MNSGENEEQKTMEESPSEMTGGEATATASAGETGALQCIECGTSYSFTEEERAAFTSRGFQTPKRCVECRLKRRRKRPERRKRGKKMRNRDGAPMGNVSEEQGRFEDQDRYQSGSDGIEENSYYAQALALQEQKSRDQGFDGNDDPDATAEDWDEEDNFGNSIDYKGPSSGLTGRNRNQSWGQTGNQAPLLTHHEASLRQRQRQERRSGGRFGSGGRPGGGGGRQDSRDGARADRSARPSRRQNRKERRAYDIVCASCQAATTVPFKPHADKPVYCRDCHKKMLAEGRGKSEGAAAGSEAPISTSGDVGSSGDDTM